MVRSGVFALMEQTDMTDKSISSITEQPGLSGEFEQNEAAAETRACGGQPQTALGGGNTEAGMTVEVARGSGAPPSNTAPVTQHP